MRPQTEIASLRFLGQTSFPIMSFSNLHRNPYMYCLSQSYIYSFTLHIPGPILVFDVTKMQTSADTFGCHTHRTPKLSGASQSFRFQATEQKQPWQGHLLILWHCFAKFSQTATWISEGSAKQVSVAKWHVIDSMFNVCMTCMFVVTICVSWIFIPNELLLYCNEIF